MTCDIKSVTKDELEARFQSWGEPSYRVAQVLAWLYGHRVTEWGAMSNLPLSLREQLENEYSLATLELVRSQGSRDTTQKFLWRLGDHSLIESVLIPANPALYGDASDRHTLCVSTQVGCAYGCKFCASGLEGWKRNLKVEEIVEQVFSLERWYALENLKSQTSNRKSADNQATSSPDRQASPHPRLINNLVIMGMGEPLANYDNLLKALKILNAPWGGGIGARKITISTSGLAPQIRRLAEEPCNFASPFLYTERLMKSETRSCRSIESTLRELVAACEYYQQKNGRMITLDTFLIAGINDDLTQTKPLAELARRLAKVNLIPYNCVEDLLAASG
jgi:23S rRNA (adenine2503-C2)-methyltransferase